MRPGCVVLSCSCGQTNEDKPAMNWSRAALLFRRNTTSLIETWWWWRQTAGYGPLTRNLNTTQQQSASLLLDCASFQAAPAQQSWAEWAKTRQYLKRISEANLTWVSADEKSSIAFVDNIRCSCLTQPRIRWWRLMLVSDASTQGNTEQRRGHYIIGHIGFNGNIVSSGHNTFHQQQQHDSLNICCGASNVKDLLL